MTDPGLFLREEAIVNGLRIVYARTEPRRSTGPVVLAVHGFGTTGFRTYRHVAAHLAERGVALIAPDLPGFGESDSPDVIYSLDYFADVLAEFTALLQLRRPVLLGHSMGGKIAVATAVRNADAFSGLALANPGGFARSERMLPFVAAHPVFHRLLQADWFYYRVLPRTVLGPIFHSEENRQQMARLRSSHELLDLRRTGYRKDLRALDLPGLILWGADDRILPLRTTRRVMRFFPAARVRIIPGAGHAPMKDQPQRFACEVSVFAYEVAGAA
jgi:pimeloyl-ACP methyl ester carboxylesterase